VELERLKALCECIDEAIIGFNSRKVERRSFPLSQRGSFFKPPQSMRQEKEINAPSNPMVLKEVLNSNTQVTLSALLTCVLNLRDNLIAWLS